MSARTTSPRPERKNPKRKSKAPLPSAYPASALSMAAQNLTNLIAIAAVTGAVLLGLLAAKHL
jgi:hypothetical protein